MTKSMDILMFDRSYRLTSKTEMDYKNDLE